MWDLSLYRQRTPTLPVPREINRNHIVLFAIFFRSALNGEEATDLATR